MDIRGLPGIGSKGLSQWFYRYYRKPSGMGSYSPYLKSMLAHFRQSLSDNVHAISWNVMNSFPIHSKEALLTETQAGILAPQGEHHNHYGYHYGLAKLRLKPIGHDLSTGKAKSMFCKT